jgi:hypothetical protein
MIVKTFSMKALRLPYSILLPIIALIVWGVIVFVPALLLVDWLHHPSTRLQYDQAQTGTWGVFVAQYHDFSWSFEMIASLRAPLVNGINLPGSVLNSLASLLLFGSARWHPTAMAPETLRVITTPVLCLPAWWFVGRGVEAILGSRKARLPMLASGAVLCAMFLASAIALRYGMPPQDRTEMTVPIWSFFFWAAAFAIPTIAWCIQKMRRIETVPAKN